MPSYIFSIKIEPDRMEDGSQAFHAWCPALKGCHTWGHTREEALARAQEAVELYIQDLLDAGEPVPADPSLGAHVLADAAVAVNR